MSQLKGFFTEALSETRQLAARWLPWTAPERKPSGPDGVAALGHREYVGGKWDTLGKLQFEFLRSQGLQPRHTLLDIACGSLRGGVHFIPYLDVGNYLGIDKEESLIAAGKEHELGAELLEGKRPRFVVSSAFEFEKFEARPDYAWAHSLFTHLPPATIGDCLSKLRGVAHHETLFFATFFECRNPQTNPDTPHDHGSYLYTREEMEQFGQAAGWSVRYLGDWDHPRHQKMMLFFDPVDL